MAAPIQIVEELIDTTPEEIIKDDILTLPCTFLVNGPSGSGKTTIVNHFLRHIRDKFTYLAVFSGTWNKHQYYPHVTKNRHRPCKIEILLKLLADLERRATLGEPVKALIILDDFIGSIPAAHCKELDRIVSLNRHWDCSFMFLVQKFQKVSTTIRDNCRHMLFCSPMGRVWDEYLKEYSNCSKEEIKDFQEQFGKEKYKHLLLQLEDIYKPPFYRISVPE